MDYLAWFLALVGAMLGAVMLKLLTSEVEAYLPELIKRLIDCAVSILPANERARLREEWIADNNDFSGSLTKLFRAFGYLFAAYGIARLESGIKVLIFERFQTVVIAEGERGAFAISINQDAPPSPNTDYQIFFDGLLRFNCLEFVSKKTTVTMDKRFYEKIANLEKFKAISEKLIIRLVDKIPHNDSS